MTEEIKKTYIYIQPRIEKKWVAKIVKEDELSPAPDDPGNTVYNTLEEAIEANQDLFGDEYEFKIDTIGNAYEKTTFDEETLIKVYSVMQRLEIPRDTAIGIVRGLLNEGILFRERAE